MECARPEKLLTNHVQEVLNKIKEVLISHQQPHGNQKAVVSSGLKEITKNSMAKKTILQKWKNLRHSQIKQKTEHLSLADLPYINMKGSPAG